MLFSSPLLFTIASALAAIAAPTGPALELKLTGPNEVTDVANLKIVATVTNTGSETLKLLNDPRGVMNDFPTEAFAVQHDESGVSPTFIGARVKYVPAKVIEMNDPASFTVLAPGESTHVTHDLSAAYDFSQTGVGKYSFVPFNTFHYVDPATSEAVPIYARSADAHLLTLSGSLVPAATPSGGLDSNAGQATYPGCTIARTAIINAAIPVATNYASTAYTYLDTHTNTTTRYSTWFGTYTTTRHDLVKTHFNNIKGNNFSSFTYDCSTCTHNDWFAYVYANQFGTIYLCGVFWIVPTIGTDSQGGTLVHEASHFTVNGGTTDVKDAAGNPIYGQSGCKNLASTDPDKAVTNADNHEYFAENNPPLA